MKSYRSDSKDKYYTMERKEQVSPFKILKMVNGDDVLCKVVKEYDDALVIEMPMSVMKHMVHQGEDHIIEHTGLHRWLNYTNDPSVVVYKDRILSFGTLAPEVIFYYKMFCKRIRHEISDNENKSEESMMEQMKDNLSKVAKYLEDSHKINVEFEEDNSEIQMNTSGSKRTLH